ncbi:hypothetical protein D3C85_146720 [compost metagenome]
MNADYLVIACIFGVFGWGASEYLKARERKRVHTEVQRAIDSLRKKGFDVTFNRLAGFDQETAWEMEKVRSAGYSVTQAGKPITLSKQPR